MTKRWPLLLSVVAFVGIAASACSSTSSQTGDSPGVALAAGSGGTYLALGDSLSVGVGASSLSETAFVPLVHESLGDGYELVNLGHGGDTSLALIEHGHLSEAVTLIEDANSDGDPATDVALVTLEIGGNDLLGLYFSAVITGDCPDVSTVLNEPACSGPLEDTLTEFDANFAEILDELLAGDPSLNLLVMTLYDPFSGFLSTQSAIAVLALEGMQDTRFEEGLNDVIRRHASERGVPVVELFDRFEGKARELMSSDFIHPNDAGYREMADAVIELLND